MVNREIAAFIAGVENLFDDELINQSAAQDSLNWFNQSGRLILIPGKLLIGQAGAQGNVTGEIFGYRVDGTKVHWRKIGTKIQYDSGTVAVPNWVDVITGLTASADYAFTNYSSLAGAFTFAIGFDGIFKMNNANPGSYLALYDATRNFKGKAFIDKGRMILWDVPNDKTVIRGSHIDPQNGTYYQTIANESFAVGDGTTKTFAASLTKGSTATANVFGVQIFGETGALKNISAITKANPGVVTATGHGFATGDVVIIQSVSGMPQVNSMVFAVKVIDANTFSIGVDTTTYNVYSSGGTVAKCEVFTDNFLGVLSSPQGGTGTVNYMTGAVSVTFNGTPVNTGLILSGYQYENPNVGGVTDFTHSSTRIAGEGFQFPQDEGGDPILNVVIGSDGYYSMKQNSAYMLSIGDDDLTATNNVYRKNMGTESYRGSLATSQGIVFINTTNPEKPEMTILQPNLAGDALVPKILFPQFKFANYLYDDCSMETYERFILVACKSLNATNNDTLLLCDVQADTVNITNYSGRTFPSNNGNLYMGSSITQSVYQLFSGFDDDGYSIENYWIGKGETYAIKSRSLKYAAFGQNLKKYRKIRLKGNIALNQSYGVYIDYDDAGFQLVGTVLGSGSYVDYASPQTIGSNYIGESQVGGDQLTSIYPYFVELRLKKVPKFRKRTMKIVALGIGYADIEYQMDWGIDIYEGKIPARFRQKQNVSLDGKTVNNANPTF